MATTIPKGKGAAATIAAALAIAVPFTAQWEGKRNVAYRDVAGIPTICYGSIRGVKMGDRRSDAECTAMLTAEVREHMDGALKCTPILASHPQQLAAVIPLTFNIGIAGYCGSTAARMFNAGRFREACEAFLPWNKARVNGVLKPVQGLTNRRVAERALCLKGL